MNDTPEATEAEDKVESMIDKITKLLSKAERCGPAEAEAFTAKATALMTRWAIDEAVIQARRGALNIKDEVISKSYGVRGTYWKQHRELGFSIGNAFQFKLLQQNWSHRGSDEHGRFTWIGFESDISKAELLYTSLLIQAQRAQRQFANEWRAQYADIMPQAEGFKARRSFLIGFASEVGYRLAEQRRQATVEAQAASDVHDAEHDESSTSVALVLMSRQDRVREYYDEKYGKLKAGRGSSIDMGRTGGHAAGRRAGAAANLGGTGVSTGTRGSIGRGK